MFLQGHDLAEGFDVQLGDAPFPLFGQQEAAVVAVVHKEVLGEDGGAYGVAEDREVAVPVRVAVGVVAAHAEQAGESFFGFFPEQGGIHVADGLSLAGVGFPAPGFSVGGGVHVEREQQAVFGTGGRGNAVDSQAAFPERDVEVLGHNALHASPDGPRRTVSMRRAISRVQLHSASWEPSSHTGERLPGVLWPWPLSIRIRIMTFWFEEVTPSGQLR